MCSTERKYPTDKPWALVSPSAARNALGRTQDLPCKRHFRGVKGDTLTVISRTVPSEALLTDRRDASENADRRRKRHSQRRVFS